MTNTKVVFFYRKLKGEPERLLRKINVHNKFKPSKAWMNQVEPIATHWVVG